MRSISGIARAGGSATVLIAFLIAVGLGALGAPEAATIPVAVAVAVAALAFSLYKLPDFEYCVEASAPAPAGAPKLPTTELIPVALGAPELNLVPSVRSAKSLSSQRLAQRKAAGMRAQGDSSTIMRKGPCGAATSQLL